MQTLESVMDVSRISPRNLAVDLVLSEKVVTVYFVYAPQSGRREEDKDSFNDDQSAEM